MLQATNARSGSNWMDTAEVPVYAPLSQSTSTDVCVIGAGIAGLTAAYLLAREGRRVLVIDALGVGAGESGRTTAHFFPPDEWYAGVRRMFGRAGARDVADSQATATAMVEAIVKLEGIDCGFERVDGYLFALPEDGFHDMDEECAAARDAGVDAERLPRVPGLSFDTGPCVRYAHQAQFHPLRYLAGLAQAIERQGGTLHDDTRALAIERDGQALRRVRTTRGDIVAQHVVVATHTPFHERVTMHTKQAGYRTYVVGLRVPAASVPRILLWNTGDPYYYIRLQSPPPTAGDDLLIVGGADHKVGQDDHPEHRYRELERWTRRHFPMAGELEYRWSGEIMEPADGLPYLGRDARGDERVQVITGDSGNGMTNCTLGAIMVTNDIMGRPNRWQDLYDPARPVLRGIAEFVGEQVNTLAQYVDWVGGGETISTAVLGPGEGAVMRDGARRIAVCRDDQGELHAVSAVCTHLGCVVHWNAAERSWDCPCHGSRFDIDGDVLHGPAAAALAPAPLPDEANLNRDPARPGRGSGARR